MPTMADAPQSSPHAGPYPPNQGHVRVRLFGRTDVGRIREHNEDNFLIADLSQSQRGLMENIRTHVVGPAGTLFAVCDGMGGAAAGEVASKLAVDIIYEQMQAGGPPRHREELARRLVRAVEVAGMRIFAEAKLDRNRRGMGTTATAAALVDEYLFLAQVGDSRAYLLRGDKLELVTRDQSLVNQLIEAGQLTEEEAENFEHSNIILQALGTADTVQVDLTVVKLRQGDTLMMCSDGLSGMVRLEELRQALLQNPEPIDVCKVLTDKANEAGGHDNITVIVAKFEGLPIVAPDDEPAKYRKYVFTTEETTAEQAAAEHAAAAARAVALTAPTPLSSPVVGGDARVPTGGKLGATAVGLSAADFLNPAQLQQAAAGAPASTPAPASNRPPAAAAAAIGNPSPSSNADAEFRAAGIPSSGPSWIWIAAILALGLVGVGIYLYLGKG
jgi:serine/threonine protein phosphatase PrpC